MKHLSLIILLFSSFCLQALEWDFTNGESHGFRSVNYRSSVFSAGIGFQGTGLKNGYFYSPDLNIDASKYRTFTLELETDSPHVTVYFSREGAPFAAARGVRRPFDREKKQAVFNMAGHPEWRGRIKALRIDAVSRDGHRAVIRRLVFPEKKAPATSWDFTTGEHFGFRPVNYREHNFQKNAGFVGTGLKNGYFYSPKISVDAKSHPFLVIELETDAPHVTVYFSRPGAPFAASRGVRRKYDFQQKRVIFNMTGHPQWHGTLDGLRIDAVNRDGQKAVIRRIFFAGKDFPAAEKRQSGLIPNSDFSRGLAHWQGGGIIQDGAVLLPPGQTMLSASAELSQWQPLEMKIAIGSGMHPELLLYDIFGRLLEKRTLSSGESLAYLPEKAACFRVQIANTAEIPGKPGIFFFRQKELRGKIWQASWIWNRQAQKEVEKYAVFRRDFQIDDLSSIVQAILNITADDIVECRLNGNVLKGLNWDNWAIVDSFQILQHLQQGTNQLICKVINGTGPGGLLAQLDFLDRRGQVRTIGSDGHWLTGAGLMQNWWDLPASDRPLILAPGGQGPWGALDRSYFSTIRVQADSAGVTRQAGEDTVWNCRLNLLPQDDTGLLKDNRLEFSMTLTQGERHFLIAEAVISGKTLKNGKKMELSLPPIHFRHVPEGEYDLNMKLEKTRLLWNGPKRITVRRRSCGTDNLGTAKLLQKGPRPALILNGEAPCSLNHYMVEMGTGVRNYREIREALNSVSGIWIHAVWKYDRENRPSFQNIENLCTSILIRNPRAHIVLTMFLDPVNNVNMTPFCQRMPESMAVTQDGRREISNYLGKQDLSPSFASQDWLAEGDRVLQTLLEHLKKTPYGQRVAGIVPCAGISVEWMYWGCQTEGEFVDYSRPFQQAFQQYALQKYGSLDKINRKWHTDFSSLWQVVIPSKKQRLARSMEDLRIPERDQYVIDFIDCLGKVTTDAILHFCRTVKTASGNRLLTGVYYGYVNALTHGRLAQHSGHWALQRVLSSPEVDMLMGPSKYSDRGPGEGGGFMIPEASVRLNGKVCIAESDIRTHYSGQKIGLCGNLAESRAVTEREMGALFATQGIMRYYYFSKSWFFHDSRLSQVARNLAKAEQILQSSGADLNSPAHSMAVITNDNAAALTAYDSSLNLLFVSGQYPALTRSGLAFDSYLASDLERIPAGHRMWYLLNPIRLSPRQMDILRTKILRPGNTLILGYGLNVIGEDGISTAAMEALLGTGIICRKGNTRGTATLTEEGRKLAGQTGSHEFGGGKPFSPSFHPEGGLPLARTADGDTALAYFEINGCGVYFASMPALKTEMLRGIARRSGHHIYNSHRGDVTWARGGLVAVHTREGGRRSLAVPFPAKEAQSLISGECLPIREGRFQYVASPMSTQIFLCR